MLSPSRVDHLQDQLDKFIAVLVCGALIFIVGSTMGVFASQDLLYGTNFMIGLAGLEQGLGALLILAGWIKVHKLHKELNRPLQAQASRASAAGSSH